MAFNLTEPELQLAFDAIEHHGYSALVPPPAEWAIVGREWAEFRHAIAAIDLDTYRPYEPMRCYAPKSRINIRPVTLLHPQDLLIYTALTLIVRDAIESHRIPRSKKKVFSYRAGSEPHHLYESAGSYEAYQGRLKEKVNRSKYVAVTDIADFYPRLYQH